MQPTNKPSTPLKHTSPQGSSTKPDSLNVSKERSENATSMYKGAKSDLILIIGKSGRGKTTSMENLPPDQTHLISIMGKALPFMNAMDYVEGVNLTVSSDPQRIQMQMKKVAQDQSVNYLVIDDNQYVMATEFMDKALVKGYDKFTIMARNMWNILTLATKLRPGLKIFVMTHEEDTGTERKMKTLGKLLDDKITCEGLATIVLYADVSGEKDNRRYFFTTQSDGMTNAKSPRGMFPYQMPNDLKKVADRMDEYYNKVKLENSKISFDL